MGLFSILKAYRYCKECAAIHECSIQFKTGNDCMDIYYIGDKTPLEESTLDGLYCDPCHNKKMEGIKEIKMNIYPGGVISVQHPFYSKGKFKAYGRESTKEKT